MVKKYFFLFVLFMSGYGCEMVINVDAPPYDPQLVVNSFFTSDSLWSVHVSGSLSAIDRANLQELEIASVVIYQNGMVYDTLLQDYSGYYRSTSKKPISGKTYTLRISASGFKNAEATNWLPYPVPLQSVKVRDSAIIYSNSGYADTEITLTFNDPAGQKNYYALSLIEGDSAFYYNAYPVYYSTDDASIGGEGASVGFFNDELFDGKTHEIKIYFNSDYLHKPSNSLTLVLSSFTEDGYLYNISYIKHQNSRDNPFAEPVQVYTNVKDGLGIFAGFMESKAVVK